METETHLTSEDVRRLLELFSIFHYKTKENDKRTDSIQNVCTLLFKKDYSDVLLIPNENGELATSYPSKIIIPQIIPFIDHQNNGNDDSFDEIDSCQSFISRSNTLTNGCNSDRQSIDGFNHLKYNSSRVRHEDNHKSSNYSRDLSKGLDVNKLKDLMSKARVARCRARFPIPVILYNGKYICRSATLSGGPEIYGRSGLDYLFNDFRNNSEVDTNVLTHNNSEQLSQSESSPTPTHSLSYNISDTSHLFSKVRNQDIKLLKYLNVGYICDLMVEKKKVKFGMNVTSSEKADKESRYNEFNIMSLPYPGCEFFRDYRDNAYSAEGLIYDWNQHFVDAHLIVPKNDKICDELNIDWKHYRSWDVIKLTQNYLKLLLLYLKKSDSSILIHCISGWDRTPLFMCLLRLSLWADGKVHQNLSPMEITFLTISYDWFLFGHNLNDRISKGEEILFFCFYFLKYIISEEYSIDFLTKNIKESIVCNERKQSTEGFNNSEDSQILLEENQCTGKYGGSSTSLNSSCSSASNRSHDNFPPLYFPTCNTEDIFDPLKNESDINGTFNLKSSYGKTPPTLTNSEEGSVMFSSGMTSTIINTCDESIKKVLSNGCNASHNTKTTEPVAIPAHKKIVVNSDNSLSSLSSLSRSDSWQLVSDTGSIREYSVLHSCQSPDSLSSPKTNGNSSDASSVNSNGDHSEPKHTNGRKEVKNSRNCAPKMSSIRKERLQAVRSIFYNAYSAAIGFKFKNGTENPTRLSSLIDHFAGSVGIYSSRVTAPQ